MYNSFSAKIKKARPSGFLYLKYYTGPLETYIEPVRFDYSWILTIWKIHNITAYNKQVIRI